jgi:hypothetical protein
MGALAILRANIVEGRAIDAAEPHRGVRDGDDGGV